MKATHILTEKYDTRRKLANRVLKAMNDITGCDNGTIRNPYELASCHVEDGRTLIKAIYEDGEVMYNDGWYIVEVDEYTMYVDVTGFAVKEMGINDYEIISDFEEEQETNKENNVMKTKDLLEAVENLKAASAWNKGVNEYAYEVVEAISEYVEDMELDNVENVLLNGASDWSQYSYGGSSLIYDGDIAERLCTPSELKKVTRKDGSVRDKANIRETWLDCQARALHQACRRIKGIIRNNG